MTHEGMKRGTPSDNSVLPISDVRRYEFASFIGPCTEEAAIALSEALLEFPEFRAVFGGGVSLKVMADDDPLFAEDSP